MAPEAALAPKTNGHAPSPAKRDPERARMHGSLGELLLRQQRYAQAAKELTQALEFAPDNPSWLAARARAEWHMGNLRQAMDDVSQAITLDPREAKYADLLGLLFMQYKEFDHAVVCFHEAVQREPEEVMYYQHLAEGFRAQGGTEAAIELYGRLIIARPDIEPLFAAYADLLNSLGRHQEAAGVLDEAVKAGHGSPAIFAIMIDALMRAGDKEAARSALTRARATHPNDPLLEFHATMLSGAMPSRQPEAMIRAMFSPSDAMEWEHTHLFTHWYRVPGLIRLELLAQRPMLDPDRPAPYRLASMLDLGCGTGLVGAAVQGLGVHMKGVDLSAPLVRFAHLKRCYNELEICDVMETLTGDPRLYEAVFAGDVLRHFGDLAPVMKGIHDRLLPTGIAVFTIDAAEPGVTWVVGNEGGFLHGRAYVETTIREAGLEIIGLRDEKLRKSKAGSFVDGYLISVTRPVR